MHKTNTVDYSVVYDGEMWLALDDGETVHLKRGDVVVQKRYAPRMAKQRHQARHNAVFPKWREIKTMTKKPEWILAQGMSHARGALFHPQAQGTIERWHQTL
jgi:quercetin dioxygenase-like cupin family protein